LLVIEKNAEKNLLTGDGLPNKDPRAPPRHRFRPERLQIEIVENTQGRSKVAFLKTVGVYSIFITLPIVIELLRKGNACHLLELMSDNLPD
jgi:hypothetical protein